MANTKPTGRDRTLADLRVGESAVIVGIDGVDAGRLGALGFRPGPQLIVEGDTPFRGPRIVRLGAARIALARSAARSIRVGPRHATVTETQSPR